MSMVNFVTRFPKIFVSTCSDLSNHEKCWFLWFSNYLKYMENFDYRSILVDSGSIVQCMYGYCVRRLHSAESKSCCHRMPWYWRKTDVTGCRRRSRYLHWFRLLYFRIHKLTCLAFNPVFMERAPELWGSRFRIPEHNYFWQLRLFSGGRQEATAIF